MPDSQPTEARKNRAAPLFRVDGRTRLGRRIASLEAMYAEAMGGELTPVQAEQATAAAQLTALAERARTEHVRGMLPLDDVVRAERIASLAVKRLNIKSGAEKSALSLADYLAKRGAK